MRSPAARPLRAFYKRVMRRGGKKIAIVALARKLLTIAYGVLKHGAVHNPAVLRARGPTLLRAERLAAAQ